MTYRTTFRTKLLLLTIVPLAVAQVVSLFAVMRTVQQDVRSRAQQSLTVGAVVVDEYLAARDLLDEYLPYHVIQSLKEQNLPAHRLTLEVTESSIMEDLRRSLSVLDCLKEIGVRISMDDFGTGHSSLAQLRNIPLHELKIDKTFIRSLCDDEHNESIVRTTVELAHGMGLSVVAEGVEDGAAMRRISGFGCEQAQGYLISKPIPAGDVLTWLDSFKPVSFPDRRGKKRVFAG
jgi:EAL domain-containing protein (putative c-di-GMP-specific phosphodiesterase class I)